MQLFRDALSALRAKLRFIKYIFIVGLRYTCNKPITSRVYLPSLLTILGLTGKGVEVGVCLGEYSEMILSYSKLTTLYLVDPWREFNRDAYFDTANVNQEEQDKRYEFVIEKFQRYGKRVKILRNTSSEAHPLFNMEELDFIYIDANHSYEECKRDLEMWWPKLKARGVFAGHDYIDNLTWNWRVKKAVDEFINKEKQKLFITNGEFPTWYLIKKI